MLQPLRIAIKLLCLTVAVEAAAQSAYQVVQLTQTGTISGTVKWSGPTPHIPSFLIDKDPQICDPDSRRTRDLEQIDHPGPQNGVANTVVFIKDISSGKAMDIPEPRRFLDQKQCRYEPTSS